MLRKGLLAFVCVLAGVAAIAWWRLGPFNGPPRPPPRDQWETLLRERIKLPEGYRLEVFARGLGRPRLMQMTENGDLIVSGYRKGNILLLKADKNGDGRNDGRQTLREGLNQPHGLLLEGRVLTVAEERRVVSHDFDGAALANERVILDGIPGGGGAFLAHPQARAGWISLCISWLKLQCLLRATSVAVGNPAFQGRLCSRDLCLGTAQHGGL